jgi:hypothetical protein
MIALQYRYVTDISPLFAQHPDALRCVLLRLVAPKSLKRWSRDQRRDVTRCPAMRRSATLFHGTNRPTDQNKCL